MKILKYIGIALIIIVITAGIAAGGYFLAVWHTNDKNDAVKTASTSTATTQSTPEASTTPVKKETLSTCNADELSLATASNGNSGAGTLSFDLVLTNTGKRDCTLGGYPGVSLVNDNGNQIGSPAARVKNSVEKTITLKPKATTTATVFYTNEGNYDAGVCKDGATKLRLYPPNDTGYLSVMLPADVAWCPGFEVSPVK